MTALELWMASLPDAAPSALPKPLRLVISGPPRTLKNSPILIRGIGDAFLKKLILDWEMEKAPRPDHSEGEIWEWLTNRDTQMPPPRLLPSRNYTAWHTAAVRAILPILEGLRIYFPITYPVHVLAKVYRDADRGDWCGYAQGIGDFLEDVGVLKDDVLIRSWDGARLLKDEHNPRIELWVQPYSQEGDTGLFSKSAKEWGKHEEPEPAECAEPVPEASRLTLITRYART